MLTHYYYSGSITGIRSEKETPIALPTDAIVYTACVTALSYTIPSAANASTIGVVGLP